MKKILLSILFLVVGLNIFSQNLFYQDVFYGGVTAGGFSAGLGSGSGSFNLHIEPGSTIKKAYLFTYRVGYPPNVPITINGSAYLFDTTNVVMSVKHENISANPVHLYYYDFTDSLNTNITSNFNVTIPSQLLLPINWGYWTISIYIVYENLVLPKVATSLWINDQDFLGNESYTYNNMNPIDTNYPVGLSLFMDRACNQNSDWNNITLNGNNIGSVGGSDAVNFSVICGGAKGHFYYQNNTLFGLDDDAPNNLMDSTDALANISSYLLNNAIGYNLNLMHNNNTNPGAPNLTNFFINSYTTPCDTFSTNVTANDTVCLGGSLQLQATGGSVYSWFSVFGGLNDTSIANPVATPTQTSTYIVTIKNDSGCVKTEQVKIWVNPLPEPIAINTVNTTCGNTIGNITVDAINNGGAPFNYSLLNLMTQNTITQPTNTFNQLDSGFYLLTINDNNGCSFTDIIALEETNNVVANFTATPDSGIVPLAVNFVNTSIGANIYDWTITENGLGSIIDQVTNPNTNYIFENSGNYQTCLISYNNILRCADTICKTIIVKDEINFIVPNVFSPNRDDKNDLFIIKIDGASLLKSIGIEIFNRWGEKLNDTQRTIDPAMNELVVWDGRTTAGAIAPEGTYFYVINYETTEGAVENLKGSLTLLR
ncbi:MAG: gliding motility-associated C-terminal domain-containing protein [Vicingaceae bacterium]|nr:gliding motility-associated C-terminal domain-containing protein [Vicingaceae bacterium]